MKGILSRALIVALVLSNVQTFSMFESFKQHASSIVDGAGKIAQKTIEAGKAQPYVAAGVGLGLLGATGLSMFAYRKYQANKAEAQNCAAAMQVQREELAKVVDVIVTSVAKAQTDNNPVIFSGKNYQENSKQLEAVCKQLQLQKQFNECTANIAHYVFTLNELAAALNKKVQNSNEFVAQVNAQHAVVIKQLLAIKTAIQNPVVQPASKLARFAKWTGIATVAAGAAYGALKLWNWYKG